MKSTKGPSKVKAGKLPASMFSLCLPPRTSLSDFFIDGSQVVQELYITKRTLLNWRSTGKISYCDEFGKIYYFKQEIAKILLKGKKRSIKKTVKKDRAIKQ
ncbi:MAG: hypothetical protein ACTHM7_18015 [Ginsengibacter sp.]